MVIFALSFFSLFFGKIHNVWSTRLVRKTFKCGHCALQYDTVACQSVIVRGRSFGRALERSAWWCACPVIWLQRKKRRCSFSPHECSIYPSPGPPLPFPPPPFFSGFFFYMKTDCWIFFIVFSKRCSEIWAPSIISAV